MNDNKNFNNFKIGYMKQPQTAATLPAAVSEWSQPLANHFNVTTKMVNYHRRGATIFELCKIIACQH